MSAVSVPVQVLLWVEVEDGTDAEVGERAYQAVERAIPGMDGAGPVLFDARCVNEVITYVTYGEEQLDLAVAVSPSGEDVTHRPRRSA